MTIGSRTDIHTDMNLSETTTSRTWSEKDKRFYALYAAYVGLSIVTISDIIITSDACGPGRLNQLDYASEDILTCKHNESGGYQAVPWFLLIGFALLLPSIWYTWMRVAMKTEYIQLNDDVLIQDAIDNEDANAHWKSRHGGSRAIFALLLVTAFVGMTMGIHYELDGVYPNGIEFKLAHRVGVVVWAFALFAVHALTLLAYMRLSPRGAPFYTCNEVIYGVLLIVFAVVYFVDEGSASFLQTVMLTVVWFLCLGNIMLAYSLEHPNSSIFCSLPSSDSQRV